MRAASRGRPMAAPHRNVGFKRRGRQGVRVSADALATMRTPTVNKKARLAEDRFKPYEPLKGVLPKGVTGKQIAMDAAFDYSNAAGVVNLGDFNELFGQGYAWPGFQILAEWAQVPEFRRPAEVYAREMTRKWIKFFATSEKADKTDRIKELEAEFDRLAVQATIRHAIQLDGEFGRGQVFLDVGRGDDPQDNNELKTELVLSDKKVNQKVKLRRLVTVEPVWSYPNRYNANDPIDPTFYKPTSWYVMGREIHSTRLLTVISRPVPDILKPSYAFAGLSLSQMVKPYVDNWLRTRQSVSDLLHSFTVWTLKTNMGSILNAGAAADFFARMQLFNQGRDNHGVNAIDFDTEEFANVSAPLGSLDKLQAQSQEQMCAPTGLPLVYLTGITPSGLNASSQGEIEVFQDTLGANQEIYTPVIQTISQLVQLSLWGEIDADIGFRWEPLKVQTPKEKAETRKLEAEIDAIDIENGALTPSERRKRVANEEDSPYAGIDVDDVPEPPEEPGQEQGMQGSFGGHQHAENEEQHTEIEGAT